MAKLTLFFTVSTILSNKDTSITIQTPIALQIVNLELQIIYLVVVFAVLNDFNYMCLKNYLFTSLVSLC